MLLLLLHNFSVKFSTFESRNIVGALWVCIVLNPNSTSHEKQHWKALLEKWTRIDVCPPEDPDFRLQQPGHPSQRDSV